MEPAVRQVMTVDASTSPIRPVVVAAILRDITFDPKVCVKPDFHDF